MKALILTVAGAVLTAALFLGGFALGHKSGFAIGQKSVPRVLVFDIKADKWVPLQLTTDTKLAVASPLGTEPGVAYKILEMKDEGMVAIILPPSLIPDSDDDQKPQPKEQNQSDRERVDHAQVLRAAE